MFDKLSIPVKGEPPRAAWGAGVANRLNELCAMTPARALVRDGATGTGFASLPVNARGFRPSRIHPRQFTLRARIETDDDRRSLVVEYYSCGQGVIWNNFDVGAGGEPSSLSAQRPSWIEISNTQIEDGDAIDKTFYLNIEISAYCEWGVDQGLKLDGTHSGWEVSEDPNHPGFEIIEGVAHHITTHVTIGRVKFSDGNLSVIQNFDGHVVTVHPWLGGDSGGSGGGEGGDPGTTVTEWVKANVVTSLNAQKGDLELSLSEGWMEIMKNGAAVNAVGTVTTSVSGLIGDMAVIGGNRITVAQEGNSLRIAYDEGKTEDDDNPFADKPEECGHPGAGGGVLGGGMGDGVSGENRGDDAVAGADCCGGSSGESAGVSTAEDGKGAATGTVVSKDDDGNTTTSTSYPGRQKSSAPGQSAPGKRLEDIDPHSGLNSPSTKGRQIGTGDIRKFENNDKRSNGSAGRIGTTDIHGFYNGAKSAKAATRL